jgi:hypothetical protein
MDEIISQVSQRTGLPPEQARQAVQVVLEQLKARLPAPIGSHLDQFLAGGGTQGNAGSGGLGDLAKGLGGMFNR